MSESRPHAIVTAEGHLVDSQLLKSRAQAIERRHARRMVSLFTHAPVAIAILRGPEHVCELANSEYRSVIGGGRDVVGESIREALPELASQGIFELLDRVRASGEPYIGQSRRLTLNRGPNGEPEDAYFDFVYQPMFDDDGRVDSIVIVAHDVTALATANHFRKPGTPAIVAADVGSTDANIAVSMGIPAVAIGASANLMPHRLEESADARAIVPGIKSLIALAVALTTH